MTTYAKLTEDNDWEGETELAPITLADRCTVELPVKDRVWPYTDTVPCGMPGRERVTDAAGVSGIVCDFHAQTILRKGKQ